MGGVILLLLLLTVVLIIFLVRVSHQAARKTANNKISDSEHSSNHSVGFNGKPT